MYNLRNIIQRWVYISKRNINVELSRVSATLLVIVLHILGQGGVLDQTAPNTVAYWSAWFLETCAYCAVNIFVLISGYVMVNKSIKLKNIVGLWFNVLFYLLLITFLFFVFLPEARSIKNLLVSFMPIVGGQWWYISSYFVLFFFIPILNTAINNIPQKNFTKLLIVALIGICVIDCIFPIDAFEIADGYSPLWFMIVYSIGAYIKKYNLQEKITAKKSLICYFAMIIFTLLSKAVIRFASKLVFGQEQFDSVLISYISITIVFSAIFLFLFCLNVKLNNTSKKVISFFAPATLGVYLIHVHPLVFQFIIKNNFASFAHKPFVVMLICIISTTLVIFLLCSAIELLRIQLFKLLKVNKMCEFIDNKATYLYSKIFK